MSSIMRARSALTGRSEGWEVIAGSSRAEGCWTFNARDRMPRSSRPTAYSAPKKHRPLRPLQSRESGFVLGWLAVLGTRGFHRPLSFLRTRRATSGLTHRSKTSAVARLFDHLVGAVKSVGGTSRPSAFATIRLTTRPNLAGCSTGRSAGFAPSKKSCRLSRPGAAEVDEGHRADGGREFLFFVADVPDADYLARCVLDRVITGHVRFAEDVDFAVESLTFVDVHYRFSLRVQDGPKRPALYAARHIGGYADIIITRLYEKRSRAAGLSLDLVDNREIVVHLG